MLANRIKSAFPNTRSLLAWSLLLLSLLAVPAVSQAATPVVFYSDLDSGPNTGGENNQGVYLSIFGRNFGSSLGNITVTVGGGKVASYVSLGPSRGRPDIQQIVVQLGSAVSTGSIIVSVSGANSNSDVQFTVNSGRIFFVSSSVPQGSGTGTVASPMSPWDVTSHTQAGDVYYFRGGTYDQTYSGTGWSNGNFVFGSANRGSAGNAVALVGYPGEAATFVSIDTTSTSNFVLADGDANATASYATAYMTFANLIFRGGSGIISGGGFQSYANSGAWNIRIVNNDGQGRYPAGEDTESAIITLQNNNWKIYGNSLHDTGGAVGGQPYANTNHIIYNSVGASYTDVAWNYFYNNRVGAQFHMHNDNATASGGPVCFDMHSVLVHHNIFTAADPTYARGVGLGDACAATSSIYIYDNLFYNLGGGFSAVDGWSGSMYVWNNSFYNINANQMVWSSDAGRLGPVTMFDVRNNIFYSNGTAFYLATGVNYHVDSNLYYGNSNGPASDAHAVNADPLFINLVGDFHLQSGSPAIDHGTSSVNTVVTMDHDGNPRPQGAGYDIGAYESPGPSLPAPQNLRITKQ